MTTRARRSFAERNQVKVGIAGIVVVALTVLVATNVGALTRIFEPRYNADFANAASLHAGDDVRISGVLVGEVEKVEVVGDHARVRFSANRELGARTTAQVKTQSLLGTKYLALHSLGPGRLSHGGTIPQSRTSVPYGVVAATSDLTRETGEIDVAQLAKAFDTMADLLDKTPDGLGRSLTGVSRLSQTIAERDNELRRVLHSAASISDVLASRNANVVRLLTDGNALLQMVTDRKATIGSLLDGVVAATRQLRGFVSDNDAQLRPILRKLDRSVAVLRKNKEGLRTAIGLYAGYGRALSEALAAGPYFYGYTENTSIVNLVPLLPALLDRQAAVTPKTPKAAAR